MKVEFIFFVLYQAVHQRWAKFGRCGEKPLDLGRTCLPHLCWGYLDIINMLMIYIINDIEIILEQ